MAYRLITQVVIIGGRVLGRAFTEAYKQANASSQYARAQAKAGGAAAGASGRANLASGMTLDEAARILNVAKPPPLNGNGGGGGAAVRRSGAAAAATRTNAVAITAASAVARHGLAAHAGRIGGRIELEVLGGGRTAKLVVAAMNVGDLKEVPSGNVVVVFKTNSSGLYRRGEAFTSKGAVLAAYRLITQVVIIGGRVLGRAFTEAYKQANASSQYARAQAKAGGAAAGASGRANLASGMTLDEAARILNVAKPPPLNGNGGGGGGGGGAAAAAQKYDMEEVMDRFKRLFDANDPQKGGSFYLQSKILRARERIEAEVGPALERAAQEAEVQAGFKPKVYKDR
ncbi:cochaperone pam16 [Niveomyces insectorum RCEF 264]|uniref:Mitochondrial import inner membrane translocase subunit TIM16 n=1 Tax=Niveomyces insectorum RCEF 264 TaxID=1081102 RepID=A0A162MBG9_9HYPO|nr:cochaperone pam16 [Niveomyces insectorum RCEF 264]